MRFSAKFLLLFIVLQPLLAFGPIYGIGILSSNSCEVNLIEPINFAEGSVQGCISSTQAFSLMRKDFKMDTLTQSAPLYFGLNSTSTPINNCQELNEAFDEGLAPMTRKQQFLSEQYISICTTLELATTGKQAQTFFSSAFDFGSLHHMPPPMLPATNSFERKKLLQESIAGISLRDYYLEKRLTVEDVTESSLRLRLNGMIVSIKELARSDFDNDSNEDILVEINSYSQYGSYRDHRLALLSQVRDRYGLVDYIDVHYVCDSRNESYSCKVNSYIPLSFKFFDNR